MAAQARNPRSVFPGEENVRKAARTAPSASPAFAFSQLADGGVRAPIPSPLRAIWLMCFISLCSVVCAENNTTNIITGVATNAGDSFIVGETGSFNDLEIRSGGGLTNGMGIIGYTISAANNNALVTGTGSRWINISNLYVGFTGSSNHLTISSGGVVKSDFGYIASDNNSANNSVLVTGTGSRWETADAFVLGQEGPNNQLTITNGGQVLCHSDAFVGGFFDSASGNSALIAGTGSLWNNDGDAYVGYFSDGNQLTLTNAGRMTNQSGYIGEFGSSSNNVAVIGTNSVWNSIGGPLTVGDQAYGGQPSAYNQLVVTNGGIVTSLGAFLGNDDTANNNQALVTGAGSRWTNSGDLYTGYSGSFNQLTIQNGGLVTDTNGYISYDGVSASNTVLVTGPNTRWTNSGNFYGGYYGSCGQLAIQNGGLVVCSNGYIGYTDGAGNNSALVAGAGSLWINRSDLSIGFTGTANQLTLLSGGQVSDVDGYIGAVDGSDNNLVLVADSGSQWSNSASLEVGFYGVGNSLIISNGGKAVCSFGRVGTYGEETVALVSGTNSQWLDSGDLYIGQVGPGTVLQIDDGGLVTNGAAYIGLFASNTTVVVTGPGSQWQSLGDLTLGYDGPDNQLCIQNGALVQAANVVVGFFDCSTNNLLSVSAASLIVTNSGNMSQIDVRRGILALTNGTVNTTGFLVSTNGALTGTGTITASGVANSGTIAPGNSPGSLTLNASLVLQANSLVSFELGGYSSGVTHDFLSVSNAAKLGGALSVTFINGFGRTITNGASFTLMTAASLSGAFTNVAGGSRLLTADGFADFVVAYSGNNLSLSQGRLDTDGDGIPNWWMMRYFGHPTGLASDNSGAQDDADGDGMSNLAEYLAGTDPRDPSSNLHITEIRPQTNDVRVAWTIVGGRKYVLQGAPGGSSSSFTNSFVDVSPLVIAPGTGESVTNYVEAGALTNSPARYYRVRLVP